MCGVQARLGKRRTEPSLQVECNVVKLFDNDCKAMVRRALALSCKPFLQSHQKIRGDQPFAPLPNNVLPKKESHLTSQDTVGLRDGYQGDWCSLARQRLHGQV